MTALPVELSPSVGQLPDLFRNSVHLLRIASEKILLGFLLFSKLHFRQL